MMAFHNIEVCTEFDFPPPRSTTPDDGPDMRFRVSVNLMLYFIQATQTTPLVEICRLKWCSRGLHLLPIQWT